MLLLQLIHHVFILLFCFLDNVTIYFLKDVLSRKKAYLHVDDIKTLHVPQYKNLTLEKIMDFVRNKPRVG